MQCPACGASVDEVSVACGGCGADTRYTVRTPDGATYGPYPLAALRQFSAEGRIPPGTLLERSDRVAVTPAQVGLSVAPPVVVSPTSYPRTGASGTTCVLLVAVGLALLLPVMAILAAILFPVFSRARDKARQAACASNVKQIALALHVYAQDHKDALPDAATWRQDLAPYLGNAQRWECPSSHKGQQSYEFNPKLNKVKLSSIAGQASTPMVYDAGLASHAGPHNGGGNVGYVDGHAKWVPIGQFQLTPSGP